MPVHGIIECFENQCRTRRYGLGCVLISIIVGILVSWTSRAFPIRLIGLLTTLLLCVSSLMIVLLMIQRWIYGQLKRRHLSGFKRIQYQSLRFVVDFYLCNLIWAFVGYAGSLILMKEMGPLTWVIICAGGASGCATGLIWGMLPPGKDTIVAVCANSPVPGGIKGVLARLGATVCIRERYRQALTHDFTRKYPLIHQLGNVLDLCRLRRTSLSVPVISFHPIQFLKQEMVYRLQVVVPLFLLCLFGVALFTGLTDIEMVPLPFKSSTQAMSPEPINDSNGVQQPTDDFHLVRAPQSGSDEKETPSGNAIHKDNSPMIIRDDEKKYASYGTVGNGESSIHSGRSVENEKSESLPNYKMSAFDTGSETASKLPSNVANDRENTVRSDNDLPLNRQKRSPSEPSGDSNPSDKNPVPWKTGKQTSAAQRKMASLSRKSGKQNPSQPEALDRPDSRHGQHRGDHPQRRPSPVEKPGGNTKGSSQKSQSYSQAENDATSEKITGTAPTNRFTGDIPHAGLQKSENSGSGAEISSVPGPKTREGKSFRSQIPKEQTGSGAADKVSGKSNSQSQNTRQGKLQKAEPSQEQAGTDSYRAGVKNTMDRGASKGKSVQKGSRAGEPPKQSHSQLSDSFLPPVSDQNDEILKLNLPALVPVANKDESDVTSVATAPGDITDFSPLDSQLVHANPNPETSNLPMQMLPNRILLFILNRHSH